MFLFKMYLLQKFCIVSGCICCAVLLTDDRKQLKNKTKKIFPLCVDVTPTNFAENVSYYDTQIH